MPALKGFMKDRSLMTTGDVACLCKVHISTVRLWIKRGDAPEFTKLGHHWVCTVEGGAAIKARVDANR